MMFTAQPVNNIEHDDSHPINAQFENEAQTTQEMTSHDLANPGDLEQGEGHTLEQMESHCPQTLSQPDVTSVQGSYVSLLADIATIEQGDDFSDQQIAHDISDTVDYATTTFTGQGLTPLQNENMVSYQAIDNSNIGYGLTNTVGNTQGIQQFVIIQPFLGDTSVSSQSAFIHLPNTAESHLNLGSNKELEDAVANITDRAVNGDTGVVTDEGGATADESYVVCTNSRGEVKEIQVIQGQPTWTENDAELPNKRSGTLKGLYGKRRKSVISERKESSSHLKKFSLDDLNSGGKSKKEVFDEYLEKSKEKIIIESLESKVAENLKKIQNANEEENIRFNEDCSENIDEASEEVKSLNELDKSKTVQTKTGILRRRQTSDTVLKRGGKLTISKGHNKVFDSESYPLIKEKDYTKLKKENITLKRKKSVTHCEESCKVSKLDKLDENGKQVEDNALDNDIESRMMNDFCRLFRSEEKCVLYLEPITLKLLNPNRVMTIEMEIEKDVIVSTIEKCETTDGFTKYSMKLTAPENALLTKSGETNDSDKKRTGKTNKSKCLKRSRLKCKRMLLKGNKVISGENIQKPLLREEDMQENIEVPSMNSDNADEVAMSEIDSCVDVGVEDDENEDVKAVENELETPKETDVSSKHDVDYEGGKVTVNNEGDKVTVNNEEGKVTANDEESKVTDSNCKRRKTRNFTGKKNQKANQNITDEKKEESSQNYTVMISDEGKKVFQCVLCGKEMSIKQNMDVHINQHTGERPWQCEVCGLGFRGPSNLKAHMNQHDEELRFSCNICFRKFRDRGTYRQHYKRHLGEKKHVCEHCGKSFVITSDLKKHIRTHTGEKPYKCSTCDQQFSDGSSLVRHEKMHAAKFRYECSACNRQYSRKDLCKKHIKKAHVNEREIEINEISIIDDLKQVSGAVKVKNQDNLEIKRQKIMRKNLNREQGPNVKVKKLKKSWQNLTEEASKRYKEQRNEIIPGTSVYREFPNTVMPTYNIDYQSIPTIYGNINQKYLDHQKPPVSGYSDQEMLPPPGPLVFQSYIRNLADSDV